MQSLFLPHYFTPLCMVQLLPPPTPPQPDAQAPSTKCNSPPVESVPRVAAPPKLISHRTAEATRTPLPSQHPIHNNARDMEIGDPFLSRTIQQLEDVPLYRTQRQRGRSRVGSIPPANVSSRDATGGFRGPVLSLPPEPVLSCLTAPLPEYVCALTGVPQPPLGPPQRLAEQRRCPPYSRAGDIAAGAELVPHLSLSGHRYCAHTNNSCAVFNDVHICMLHNCMPSPPTVPTVAREQLRHHPPLLHDQRHMAPKYSAPNM
ncbi:hypothetical protein DB88DRAFT_471959 [Papiliotrema laurentii]|uniref:Uncharacterized protein n=1 Tax=Papiliotrema laurentii TaxID=5418 RepID=A0AAD9FQX6_PAPLA|nr:hypothetical protein DB88DRAFT_471959 [Papiliotrema laurentii]